MPVILTTQLPFTVTLLAAINGTVVLDTFWNSKVDPAETVRLEASAEPLETLLTPSVAPLATE